MHSITISRSLGLLLRCMMNSPKNIYKTEKKKKKKQKKQKQKKKKKKKQKKKNKKQKTKNKGYKNPHKPKAKVHTTLTPKTIIKLSSFAIYFN